MPVPPRSVAAFHSAQIDFQFQVLQESVWAYGKQGIGFECQEVASVTVNSSNTIDYQPSGIESYHMQVVLYCTL